MDTIIFLLKLNPILIKILNIFNLISVMNNSRKRGIPGGGSFNLILLLIGWKGWADDEDEVGLGGKGL